MGNEIESPLAFIVAAVIIYALYHWAKDRRCPRCTGAEPDFTHFCKSLKNKKLLKEAEHGK